MSSYFKSYKFNLLLWPISRTLMQRDLLQSLSRLLTSDINAMLSDFTQARRFTLTCSCGSKKLLPQLAASLTHLPLEVVDQDWYFQNIYYCLLVFKVSRVFSLRKLECWYFRKHGWKNIFKFWKKKKDAKYFYSVLFDLHVSSRRTFQNPWDRSLRSCCTGLFFFWVGIFGFFFWHLYHSEEKVRLFPAPVKSDS